MNRRLLLAITTVVGFSSYSAFAQDSVQVNQTVPVVTSTTSVVQSTPAVIAPAVIVNQQTTPPPPPPKEEKHKGWGEFNISGGKALFQGSSSDYLEDAAAVEAGFYGPMKRTGQFGLEGGYIVGAKLKGALPGRLNPIINGNPATGPFTTDTKANIVRATPEFRFGPLMHAGDIKIMPYVVGGGGFYWTHYTDDPINFSNGSSGQLNSKNDYNGGWNAGGGLTLGLGQGLGIGFDVRYHDILYTHGPDTTYWLPTGKLVLFF